MQYDCILMYYMAILITELKKLDDEGSENELGKFKTDHRCAVRIFILKNSEKVHFQEVMFFIIQSLSP